MLRVTGRALAPWPPQRIGPGCWAGITVILANPCHSLVGCRLWGPGQNACADGQGEGTNGDGKCVPALREYVLFMHHLIERRGSREGTIPVLH